MHIDYPTLSAFADGDLDPASSADVSAHLLACAKCQGEAQFIRELGDGLRALQTPSAPRHAFDRIWPEDREAAPVSELRTHGREPMQRGWRIALAAGVVGLMAAAFVLTFGADRAMAGASALTLERADGGAMTLRYETISPLGAETSVRARIRYWIPDSLRFAQNEGRFSEIELSREAPGRFEGVADLPPGTVYAVATVEDREGTYLDTDFGRFWEYLEPDGRGRPTLDARRYQVLAALELNAGAAAIAQRAAAEFPGQPEFWLWLLSFELAALPADSIDTLLSTREARLSGLDRAARGGNPGPVEIDALSRYARLLERPDVADYWWGELRKRYPHHGSAALVRLQEIFLSQATTEEKLAALEEDWASVGAPATAQLGLRYSYELADPVLTEEWLRKHEASSWARSLSFGTEVARSLMEVPALWTLAERWILDRLSDSRDWVGPERRLDQSRYNFEAGTRQSRANLYLYLSRLRLDRGDIAGGIDALERSVEETWNPQVFARAAEIHRSLGSDARAAQLTSLARVDPVVPLEPYLSDEDNAARRTPADAQLAAARAAMQERVVAGLLNEYVNFDGGLRTETGGETALDQADGAGRGVTLVLYTSRPDFVPDEDFALLTLNAERLNSTGVRTVLVTQRTDSSPGDRPEIDAQFLHDPDYRVWEELGAWRTLQYFVLDRGGRLRHRGEELETALRISLVLAM
ncbi:anti-sigma factor family protein [Candidatus Palauibacter sp.]|uniref:anti-sigma factor family protein n=1 Tax=Candidatus Palauibacter sp. TaxID=3101350 RepID=UPI003B5155EA